MAFLNKYDKRVLDLKYSLTEEDNISGVTKTRQLLQEGNKIPYPETDNTLIVEKDKTHTRASALTIGKNIDDSSSLFFNFGIDINTIEKKKKGDSDVLSSSLSYFKVLGDHYISPYVYWNKPNYRRQEDYQTLGAGINNTFILNEKNNLNYSIGYSNTDYVDNPTFDTANNIVSGNHPFKDYWLITGPLLDYVQSLFFIIFGQILLYLVLSSTHFSVSLFVSGSIAEIGHSGSHTPQSIHSSGLITSIFSPS